MLLEFFGTEIGKGPQYEPASQPGRDGATHSELPQGAPLVDRTKQKPEAKPTGVRCKWYRRRKAIAANEHPQLHGCEYSQLITSKYNYASHVYVHVAVMLQYTMLSIL
jgi:hypothetical protein